MNYLQTHYPNTYFDSAFAIAEREYFAKPKTEKEIVRIDHVTIITDRKEDTLKPFLESKLKGFLGYKVSVIVICIDSETTGDKVEVYPTELGGQDDINEVQTFIESIL